VAKHREAFLSVGFSTYSGKEVAGFALRSKPKFPTLHQSSFGRTTWPRRALRVGLTTFLQISNEPAALGAALLHVPEKKELYHMTQGTVKWFNDQRGYRFIQPDDGSKDVFVHIGEVERAGMHGLNEGQKVAFDVLANPKTGKSSAENLRAVRSAA